VAAASAVKQLLLTHPQATLTLLPAVLFSLQQPVSCRASTPAAQAVSAAAAAQAARSGLLSIMLMGAPGTDKSLSLVPLVLRPVKPLMAPEAPALARCLALRLTVEAWLESGERTLQHNYLMLYRQYCCISGRKCIKESRRACTTAITACHAFRNRGPEPAAGLSCLH
jgi:hypothetical protein